MATSIAFSRTQATESKPHHQADLIIWFNLPLGPSRHGYGSSGALAALPARLPDGRWPPVRSRSGLASSGPLPIVPAMGQGEEHV